MSLCCTDMLVSTQGWDYKKWKKAKIENKCEIFHYLSISHYLVCLKIVHLLCHLIYTLSLFLLESNTVLYLCVFLTEPQDVPSGRGNRSIFSSCTSVLLVISLVPPFFPYFLNQVHGKDISSTQFLTFTLLPLASSRCSSTIHCPREDVAIVTAFTEAVRQDVHRRRVFSAIQRFT